MKIKQKWKPSKSDLIFVVAILAVKGAIFDWFYIPSGSMEPTLNINDRVIGSLSHYDIRIPFTTISLIKMNEIEKGDVVLFDETKSDNIFIKRVIGTEGDHVVIDGHDIKINGKVIHKSEPVIENGYASYVETYNNSSYKVQYSVKHDKIQQILQMKENKEFQKKPEFSEFLTTYSEFLTTYSVLRKGEWTVPDDHIFVIGDNRDHSNDSRFEVSFVPKAKVIGKASFVLANMKPLTLGNYSIPMIPTSFSDPFTSLYSVAK